MSARIFSVKAKRVVERPRARAEATSAALAAAMVSKVASSASRSAKPWKKAVIAASGTALRAAKAVQASSMAAVTVAASAAGMCSRAPSCWLTTRRSPATKASANSGGTRVKRSPPKMIVVPAISCCNGSLKGIPRSFVVTG